MCKGCQDSEKPKQYKILERNKKLGQDYWIVKYLVWRGCFCNRTQKEAIVKGDRLPLMKDLLRAI